MITHGQTRLPRDVYEPLAGNAGVQQLMVFLLSRHNRGTGTIPPMSRATIARNLGCSVRTVSARIAQAVEAGVLQAKQARRRAPYTFAVVTAASSRWENVPTGYHLDVAARRIPHAYLPAWLYIDRALGAKGHTDDTPAKLAQALGISERALRRRVARFAQTEHLVVTGAKDGRWTLSRPGVDLVSSTTTQESATRTGHTEAQSDTTDCNLTAPQIAHLVLPAPENYAPENGSSSSRRDVDLSDARDAKPTALRAKQKPSSLTRPNLKSRPRRPWRAITRPDVARVYDALPAAFRGVDVPGWADDHGTHHEAVWWAAKYRPGVLAQITRVLATDLTLEAALRAVTDLANFDTTAPGQHLPGLHVPGIGAALHAKTAQINHGLACRSCGDDQGGHSSACHLGSQPLRLDVRLAAWRAVDASLAEVLTAGDSEAADVLAAA